MKEKGYDKQKIGEKINRGFDRTVYCYDENRVIKFSFLAKIIGKKFNEKMRHDYKICKKYFGAYVLDTDEVSTPGKLEHIEIQPFIKGSPLSKQHLQDQKIKLQLEDISSRLGHLIADGYSPADLVGHAGMLRLCLSNILVDQSGKLHLIDACLLEGRSIKPFGFITIPFFPIARIRQRHILNKFLK